MIVEDKNRDPNLFYPPLFAVHIEQDSFRNGVRVFFSDFSVPFGTELSITKDTEKTYLRGIANIILTSPDKYNDEKVVLRVYLMESEKTENINIYALKNKVWTPLRTQDNKIEEVSIGIYTGYLDVKLKIGDPPIAVG